MVACICKTDVAWGLQGHFGFGGAVKKEAFKASFLLNERLNCKD
jgi:hypothetical protein